MYKKVTKSDNGELTESFRATGLIAQEGTGDFTDLFEWSEDGSTIVMHLNPDRHLKDVMSSDAAEGSISTEYIA